MKIKLRHFPSNHSHTHHTFCSFLDALSCAQHFSVACSSWSRIGVLLRFPSSMLVCLLVLFLFRSCVSSHIQYKLYFSYSSSVRIGSHLKEGQTCLGLASLLLSLPYPFSVSEHCCHTQLRAISSESDSPNSECQSRMSSTSS